MGVSTTDVFLYTGAGIQGREAAEETVVATRGPRGGYRGHSSGGMNQEETTRPSWINIELWGEVLREIIDI